jgi:hypothetical protein
MESLSVGIARSRRREGPGQLPASASSARQHRPCPVGAVRSRSVNPLITIVKHVITWPETADHDRETSDHDQLKRVITIR